MRSILRQISPLRHAVHRVRQYRRRRALHQAASRSPLRVVIGASGIFQPGWTPTDIDDLNILQEADWQTFFKPNSIDVLLAEHVWEHLTLEQGKIGINHCFCYLRPGGYLRIAVPDGNHPDPRYIEYVRPGGSGVGADDHKVLYTIELLLSVLEAAGFAVHPLEYFDKEGKFHFEMWEPESGMIHRSSRYDSRNVNGLLNMTSIIVDAVKPVMDH